MTGRLLPTPGSAQPVPYLSSNIKAYIQRFSQVVNQKSKHHFSTKLFSTSREKSVIHSQNDGCRMASSTFA